MKRWKPLQKVCTALRQERHLFPNLICHFSLQFEKEFPGGQKIVFRVRRPRRFDSEGTKSNMSFKTRHMVMDATHGLSKSAKVAYVCHFGAFQDQQPLSRAPHRPSKNAKHEGGKTRLVSTSRAKRLFSKCSDTSLKTRILAVDAPSQRESGIRMPLSRFTAFFVHPHGAEKWKRLSPKPDFWPSKKNCLSMGTGNVLTLCAPKSCERLLF